MTENFQMRKINKLQNCAANLIILPHYSTLHHIITETNSKANYYQFHMIQFRGFQLFVQILLFVWIQIVNLVVFYKHQGLEIFLWWHWSRIILFIKMSQFYQADAPYVIPLTIVIMNVSKITMVSGTNVIWIQHVFWKLANLFIWSKIVSFSFEFCIQFSCINICIHAILEWL